ncbi:hypothetical protein UPYG_G00046500 [Umbra pygmaea]|uniref:Integrator complex subunit 12 n=1 Tax=Umbra pygmaea TaxID=75934 RepID=A0ABD0XR47_UMBPY
MATSVSLDLDPIFLKGLGYLHSKSKDSADKLRALLDESLSGRGSDSTYRSSQKEAEATKVSMSKISLSKQDSKSSSSSSSSSSSKSSGSEKSKKDVEKRSSEKVKVEPGEGAELLKKPRLEPKQENHSSPVTVPPFKDIPIADFSNFDAETNADDFAMEMGLACVVCRQVTLTSGNQLVECQECHNLYHQDCHKPQVTDKDVNDPRLVWYCARCTRQMKRMAQNTRKPTDKHVAAVVSAAPVMKDALVKKPELKVKPDTATTFQAFKRTEVKTSAAVSANPSGSGSSLQAASSLTGWAAFGAKNPSAGPGASTKPGSGGPSGSGKSSPASTAPTPKPTGLSGLTSSKSGGGLVGSGAKLSGGKGNNGGNGSVTSSLKPPPPLTLGKQTLSRSSSAEIQGRGTSPGSSPGGSQPNLGGNGGGNAGNGAGNGSKASASATSQESQLIAMKRLHMVKKKAAQKKMKK